jgi:hypothetical protein
MDEARDIAVQQVARAPIQRVHPRADVHRAKRTA